MARSNWLLWPTPQVGTDLANSFYGLLNDWKFQEDSMTCALREDSWYSGTL